MNGQFEAAWPLHRFLSGRNIPYLIIDGIAVQRWGEPRLTYKCVAGRPEDLLDVEGIVARQGDALDAARVRRWVNEFAQLTDDREIAARFERAWDSRPH